MTLNAAESVLTDALQNVLENVDLIESIQEYCTDMGGHVNFDELREDMLWACLNTICEHVQSTR